MALLFLAPATPDRVFGNLAAMVAMVPFAAPTAGRASGSYGLMGFPRAIHLTETFGFGAESDFCLNDTVQFYFRRHSVLFLCIWVAQRKKRVKQQKR